MDNQQEYFDRERILNVVIDGRNSEYWKVLKSEIEKWIKLEENRLRSFDYKGLKQDQLTDFNRCVDRIGYLKSFLVINDKIVYENKTYLERFKETAQTVFRRVESFVGKNFGHQG